MSEAKYKHLSFIQDIVNRLSNNGFLLKGWTVTLVSAILTISVNQEGKNKINTLVIALIPVVLFWILDGYFLWQERIFREHYKNIAKVENPQDVDFQMDVGQHIKGRNTWNKSIFSRTLIIFYLTLLLVILAVGVNTITQMNIST